MIELAWERLACCVSLMVQSTANPLVSQSDKSPQFETKLYSEMLVYTVYISAYVWYVDSTSP